jgi:hypothetical protein
MNAVNCETCGRPLLFSEEQADQLIVDPKDNVYGYYAEPTDIMASCMNEGCDEYGYEFSAASLNKSVFDQVVGMLLHNRLRDIQSCLKRNHDIRRSNVSADISKILNKINEIDKQLADNYKRNVEMLVIVRKELEELKDEREDNI